MSNSIFDWPASLKRFVRFTTAKAEDVNDALDGLSAGLDAVEANIARSVKLPAGTSDQTLAMAAGQRAGLLLGFDANGNVTAIAGGGRYRGDWVTGTLYVASDYVRDAVTKNIYSVVSQHTSGTLAADISAGRLQLAINVADVEAQRALAQNAATTATTQAGIAATKAAEAAQSALDATTNGAAQVSLATTQAGFALSRANDAETARAAAMVAKNAAELAYDSFDDRYLGAKAANPMLDNDGNALIVGALYWNTASSEMRVWDGSTWLVSYASLTGTVAKAGDSMTGALNDAATLTLASAATTNIGGQNSNNLSITGTTTITSLGTSAAGVRRRLIFDDALTLTHNATSLILPSAANITTAAGDVAEFLSLGGGNWRCAWYSRADGKPVIRQTTVGGYGITDAVTTSGDQTIAGNKSFTGNVLLTGSGSLGYGAGAGGTVTQATSKSTTVTLNKQSGQITLNGSSMAAGVTEIFQFNNSNIVAPCGLALTLVAGSGTLQSYNIWASVGAGYAIIYCKNISAGTLAEVVQIDFAVIKGATS